MRPQSKIQFAIRGKLVGGPRPLVCVPLMAASQAALREQAAAVARLEPDLIEWRVDAFQNLSDVAAVRQSLRALNNDRRSLPLLFTCRAKEEGGAQSLAPEGRLALYRMACMSGLVDLIDIEMGSDPVLIKTMTAVARSAGVKLILSYHDFDRTPAAEVLRERLHEAERAGADIAKIAVMPKNGRDVLTLLYAACEARERYLSIPLIAISMGAKGAISRIVGGQFGSDITFASGGTASAPGQLAIQDLRKAWEVLSRTDAPTD